jgi:predicted DNA-binding transcriptional regulator AlpA
MFLLTFLFLRLEKARAKSYGFKNKQTTATNGVLFRIIYRMGRPSLNYAPRLLRLEPAAAYVGIGKTKFVDLVGKGKLPKPVDLDGIRAWDRRALDAAVDELATEVTSGDNGDRLNSFDQALGVAE